MWGPPTKRWRAVAQGEVGRERQPARGEPPLPPRGQASSCSSLSRPHNLLLVSPRPPCQVIPVRMCPLHHGYVQQPIFSGGLRNYGFNVEPLGFWIALDLPQVVDESVLLTRAVSTLWRILSCCFHFLQREPFLSCYWRFCETGGVCWGMWL